MQHVRTTHKEGRAQCCKHQYNTHARCMNTPPSQIQLDQPPLPRSQACTHWGSQTPVKSSQAWQHQQRSGGNAALPFFSTAVLPARDAILRPATVILLSLSPDVCLGSLLCLLQHKLVRQDQLIFPHCLTDDQGDLQPQTAQTDTDRQTQTRMCQQQHIATCSKLLWCCAEPPQRWEKGILLRTLCHEVK